MSLILTTAALGEIMAGATMVRGGEIIVLGTIVVLIMALGTTQVHGVIIEALGTTLTLAIRLGVIMALGIIILLEIARGAITATINQFQPLQKPHQQVPSKLIV